MLLKRSRYGLSFGQIAFYYSTKYFNNEIHASFFVYLSKTALSHRNRVFTGTSRNSCRAQGNSVVRQKGQYANIQLLK
jgi:hypothetical protein